MTTVVRESPWGFRSPQPLAPQLDSRDGIDAELMVLWGEYQSFPERFRSWDHSSRVIDCAIRLFGNPELWFGQQINNPNLCLDRVEFLLDCLRVVTGQQRELRIASRAALFVKEPVMRLDASERLRVAHDLLKRYTRPGANRSVPALPPNPEVFLQDWLVNGGLEDLFCSLVVLFGPDDVVMG